MRKINYRLQQKADEIYLLAFVQNNLQEANIKLKEFINNIHDPMRELDELRRKLLSLQAEFTERTRAV